MANIAIAGGSGALSGGVSGAGLGFEAGGPAGAVIGGVVGALVFGGMSAGMAALSEETPKPENPHGDLVTTRQIRNMPVPIVCGRARLGGQWVAIGYFDQVKDFAPNVPKGTVDYVVNCIVGLCEGPIQSIGNFRLDGQVLSHWLLLENLPWQYLQWNLHYGTSSEDLFPAQSVHDNGFVNLSPNQIPWRNTCTLQCLLYTGPSNTTRLPEVNVDVVGPDLTIRRNGTTVESGSGDTPIDVFYDGYSESFCYTLSASSVTSAPFGMCLVGRQGAARKHIAPPTGVGSITKGWYLGRHDVLVFQDPSDSSTFHIGWNGITPTSVSSPWRTQRPSPDYANPILLSCLDERFGLLHTMHYDGTTVYILRWNLLTGRVDRLDTDLAAATWKSMTYSADLGAYVVANSTNLMVVDSTGTTIRSATNPATSSCLGVFAAGQQIGVVNPGSVYLLDMFAGTILGPYGSGNTSYATVGALGNITSARYNTWTGHITVTKGDGSGNPVFINFIPSCIEDIRDINANGTSGTGTEAFTEVNATGTPELDFQLPGNAYTGTDPYHYVSYTGTGNCVGSTHYPPDDNTQDWLRDWSYRTFNSWNLVALQGNSSLAAAAWNFCVDEANTDSARWGGGLDPGYFSLSSFEALHAYCVQPVTIINPDGITTRVCERFKFDHCLDTQTDLASHVSQTILACCQGYHYTMGGIFYVDAPPFRVVAPI